MSSLLVYLPIFIFSFLIGLGISLLTGFAISTYAPLVIAVFPIVMTLNIKQILIGLSFVVFVFLLIYLYLVLILQNRKAKNSLIND